MTGKFTGTGLTVRSIADEKKRASLDAMVAMSGAPRRTYGTAKNRGVVSAM